MHAFVSRRYVVVERLRDVQRNEGRTAYITVEE
jgi:hypothetical protein